MGVHAKRYGSGEKIILIHGAGGNARSWFFQKEYLKSTMEVIPIDLPGHGDDTDEKGCSNVADYVDYLHKAIRELHIDKCYMAGHSMGGAITMSFALSFPEILKGVVLIATGAKLRIFPEILEGLKTNKEKAVRNIMDYAFSKKTQNDLKENGFKDMMKCSIETIYNDFFACENFDLMDSVNRLKIPALIICGNEDALTPLKYSEYLQKNIQESRLKVVEDAGHMIIIEKPAEVNQAILEWVETY